MNNSLIFRQINRIDVPSRLCNCETCLFNPRLDNFAQIDGNGIIMLSTDKDTFARGTTHKFFRRQRAHGPDNAIPLNFLSRSSVNHFVWRLGILRKMLTHTLQFVCLCDLLKIWIRLRTEIVDAIADPYNHFGFDVLTMQPEHTSQRCRIWGHDKIRWSQIILALHPYPLHDVCLIEFLNVLGPMRNIVNKDCFQFDVLFHVCNHRLKIICTSSVQCKMNDFHIYVFFGIVAYVWNSQKRRKFETYWISSRSNQCRGWSVIFWSITKKCFTTLKVWSPPKDTDKFVGQKIRRGTSWKEVGLKSITWYKIMPPP